MILFDKRRNLTAEDCLQDIPQTTNLYLMVAFYLAGFLSFFIMIVLIHLFFS